MKIPEAQKLARLEYIGGDQFEGKLGLDAYNLGVTPRGRIYRIKASQHLGQFAVDRQFTAALRQRLTAKYGPPYSQSGNIFNWELVETVQRSEGRTVPFRTMWMSAYVGSSQGDQTLELTLIDFRILWADQNERNSKARTQAQERLKLKL